jgi:hypothetical protein
MKPEKQRIAIAEACGWKDIKDTNHESVDIESRSITYWSGLTGVPPEFIHYEWNRVIIPDYLNDLNAMHEVEKVLSRGEHYYQTGEFGLYVENLDLVRCGRLHLIEATAAQRAEAFLRTIGKWEEEA